MQRGDKNKKLITVRKQWVISKPATRLNETHELPSSHRLKNSPAGKEIIPSGPMHSFNGCLSYIALQADSMITLCNVHSVKARPERFSAIKWPVIYAALA